MRLFREVCNFVRFFDVRCFMLEAKVGEEIRSDVNLCLTCLGGFLSIADVVSVGSCGMSSRPSARRRSRLLGEWLLFIFSLSCSRMFRLVVDRVLSFPIRIALECELSAFSLKESIKLLRR